MPNDLTTFLGRIPGERSEIKDVDIFLSKTGDLREIRGIDVVLRSIMNLLLTPKGTYIMDPEYGCNLYNYIYDPADYITKETIQQHISSSLSRYESRGEITIDVKFLSGGRKGFVINILIEFLGERRDVNLKIDEELLRSVEK